MTQVFEYDVFVSHSSKDKRRVRTLAKKLRDEAGLRVWFDEWLIPDGADIFLEIERGLEVSRTLLLCMSPNTFGSEWVTLERSTTLFRDPNNRQRRFLPVLFAECDIPDTLRRFKYLDWRRTSKSVFKRIVTGCRPPGEQVSHRPGRKQSGPTPQLAEQPSDQASRPVADNPSEFAVAAPVSPAHPFKCRLFSLGHTAAILSVACLPDGKRAISGARDNTVRIWDLQTGTCTATLEGHTDSVFCVAVDPAGKRAISGASDRTVRVWDLQTGKCTATLQGHTSSVWSVAVDPAGKRAISGALDNTVRVWDLQTGKCTATLQGHTSSVRSVAVDPANKRAVSGADDHTVRVWDLKAGKCTATLQGHTSSVLSVAVDTAGKQAISGADDNTVRVWDLQTSTCKATLQGHTSSVYCVAVDLEGKRAISGALDNTVRVWDLQTGKCTAILEGHTSSVLSVAVDPAGKRATSGALDNTVRVWDLQTGKCTATLQGHTNSVLSVAVDTAGKRAISGALDNTVRAWDLQTGKCTATLQGHTNSVLSVAVDTAGKRAISGADDHTVRVWDLTTGKCTETLQGHTGAVRSVAIDPTGNRAISGALDNTVRIWDLQTGKCTATLQGHTNSVLSVAVDTEGKRAISGASDHTVRVWDLQTGKCTATLQGPGAALSVAVAPEGKRAISGADDRSVSIWDLQTGKCAATLEGHTNSVLSVAVAPEGKRAISGALDNTVRVWDLQTGTCTATLEGHTDEVWSVAVDTEGVIYSQAKNGVLRIWREEGEGETRRQGEGEKEHGKSKYVNAKVVLVGDSGVGKSGLAHRITTGEFTETLSTDGHWATQMCLEGEYDTEDTEREIWLWDFAGQPGYRLIHQLFMDETSLAALVFNPQDRDPFDELGHWDNDLERVATANQRKLAKLLVAGRCDRGGLSGSRDELERFRTNRDYAEYLETSALTGEGCETLKEAIIQHIDWDSIPWTSSPRIFRLLKAEIVKLRDEDVVLLTIGELKQRLELALPDETFTLAQLETVVGLLAGPGIVWRLSFGDLVLLQPEWINRYAAALHRQVQKTGEIGMIAEDQVLAGELDYTLDVSPVGRVGEQSEEEERQAESLSHVQMQRLTTDEAIVLRAMHQTFVDYGLCLREDTHEGKQLVFPSYFRRELPILPDAPPTLVNYRFDGSLERIYATLVVQLRLSLAFENGEMYRFAAEFKSPADGHRIGLRLIEGHEGQGELSVYFAPEVSADTKVTFIRYIHEHLAARAQNIVRLREDVCPHCQHPVSDRELTRKRREEQGEDAWLRCQNCDEKFDLYDEIERKFASDEFKQRVRVLREKALAMIDTESKELILEGHARVIAGEANQIYRGYTNSDHGIDGEIEFKDWHGNASGQRLYLQLKSGDSYLEERKDGRQVFRMKKQRWVEYWQNQNYPVMLVVRTGADHRGGSKGEIRWMDITERLKELSQDSNAIKQIDFDGEPFTARSVQQWRDKIVGRPQYKN